MWTCKLSLLMCVVCSELLMAWEGGFQLCWVFIAVSSTCIDELACHWDTRSCALKAMYRQSSPCGSFQLCVSPALPRGRTQAWRTPSWEDRMQGAGSLSVKPCASR